MYSSLKNFGEISAFERISVTLICNFLFNYFLCKMFLFYLSFFLVQNEFCSAARQSVSKQGQQTNIHSKCHKMESFLTSDREYFCK